MYHDRLLNQPSTSVEAVLAAACDAMGFDIAEMWLRTGPKTHQLTNTHLRPAALEDRVTNELVEVYYGEKSAERTHKLSPALCKRAKEAMDVVWVTSGVNGADGNALKCSISDVKTAVAVPVCHESSNTNITLIFFSLKRAMMRPPAIEFLVHMSLAAAVASANDLEDDVFNIRGEQNVVGVSAGSSMSPYLNVSLGGANTRLSRSMGGAHPASHQMQRHTSPLSPSNLKPKISVTGANLDMKWNSLQNVEYLTDGGNSWIHTAVVNGKSVVVKTLKPECQDMALAINEIEGELEIHSKLNHEHIVSLIGAGLTSKGVRFVVLERLDGGTLTQVLGYDTRIRDRRRRFFKRKQLSYLEVLSHARSLADSLAYCHGRALPGSLVLHRDVKPDNIGFTLDGTLKLIDFGLAKVVENASPDCNDVYRLSGETGSLRYMAPEVADNRPYNHKADVYSFAIILWEMLSYKKPYDGLNRETFYIRIVDGGERPPINKKWPKELSKLITDCWSNDIDQRPTFSIIVDRLTNIINSEKGGRKMKVISALIDRHSTWF
jgi:serine/threonine protein kinase